MDKLFLILEIIFIALAIILQLRSFRKTKKALSRFSEHASKALSSATLESVGYEQVKLEDSDEFEKVIMCRDITQETEEEVDVDGLEFIDLINSPVLRDNVDNDFRQVITSTNSYLVKNKGIASDFGILRDICERRIESEDSSITENLSTPLYLGLCGTFIGIVCGLLGFKFSGLAEAGLGSIVTGVSIAMIASLLGLALTTWNKVVVYPKAINEVEKAKNNYYDLLQRDLMPSLSLGIAGSLASFKDVLGSFISKFGNNISGYAETARLMNQNLESEHLVLQEINNMNITEASKTIAKSFATLKESSDDLKKFKEYQEALNTTMEKATAVTERMESIMSTFSGFIATLDRIATQSDATNELQVQFKESLETHFPTIEDHEKVWREQLDEIGKDTQRSSEELQNYLKSSSEYIRNFVGDNQTFLSGLLDMKDAVESVKQNSLQQNTTFEAYKASMESLKTSIDRLYDRETDNQGSLVTALKALLENNTNPQYTEKLTEIATALESLMVHNEDTVEQTRTALNEMKDVLNTQVEDCSEKIAAIKQDNDALAEETRKALSNVASTLKALEADAETKNKKDKD